MATLPNQWVEFIQKNAKTSEGKKFLLYKNKMFYLTPGIYESNYDSFFFAENLIINKNEKVLDLGTGSGILGIICADYSNKITATDVSTKALACAKINAKLNNAIHKIKFKRGSLFEPVKNQKFDLILADPPQQPNPHKQKFNEIVSTAIDGGSDGRTCLDELIRECPKYLADNGRIQIYHGQFASIEKSIKLAKEMGLKPKITAKGEGSFGRTSGERIEYFESLGIKIKRKNRIPILQYYILTLFK